MNNPRRGVHTLVIIWVLLCGLQSVSAQKVLRTNFLSVPPRIDGLIGEGEWQVVDSAIQFTQMEPRAGMPATELTSVYIGFDSVAIYAAFIMYQKDPDGIVGRVQQRDGLKDKSDDMVALILDTYDDKRKAYVFSVNPLGTQVDMRGNDDIFVSELGDPFWSKASPLNENINTRTNETHASMAPDGLTLYFTSDRRGGQG